MLPFLPILTFHAVDDHQSVISFSPRVFQKLMAGLNDNGYRTLNLKDAVGLINKSEPFPDRCFVMTFDDGYKSVYDEAFPVLQSYGMTATVYLTVGKNGITRPQDRLPSMEGRSMLAWNEIQEMQVHGMDFGAHTLTHPDLTRLSFGKAEEEICRSKMIIEDALSSEVFSFAYPFGYYDRQSVEIAKKNFACAFTDKMGMVTGKSDPYLMERIDAYYFRTERLFNIMFNKTFPWYVKFLCLKRGIRRAFQNNQLNKL